MITRPGGRYRVSILENDERSLRKTSKNPINIKMLAMTIQKSLKSLDSISGSTDLKDLDTFSVSLFVCDDGDRLSVLSADNDLSLIKNSIESYLKILTHHDPAFP